MITNDPNYDSQALQGAYYFLHTKKCQGEGNYQTVAALEQEHWCLF